MENLWLDASPQIAKEKSVLKLWESVLKPPLNHFIGKHRAIFDITTFSHFLPHILLISFHFSLFFASIPALACAIS